MDKEFYELAKQIDVMVVFLIITGTLGFFLANGVMDILCSIYKGCKKLWERRKSNQGK